MEAVANRFADAEKIIQASASCESNLKIGSTLGVRFTNAADGRLGKAIKAHALCRGSTTGCLLKAKEEQADLPPWLVRRLSTVLGWTGMGMMGMAMLLLAGLFMGIGVFTVLYVFKSTLGIDLVDGWHLTDWLRR